MAFAFALCPECLTKYRALAHDPIGEYTLNIMPFCSLEWPDEHPEELRTMVLDRERHEECRASILRLVGARTHLWRTGTLPEDCRGLWTEAQRTIPDWPGFKRLSLNQEQLLSLDGCAQELDDFVRAVAADFPQMTFTDKGGGLTEFSARRGETEAPQRPPMRVMEFSKGPARALALEFYPENAAAFAQELPKVKAALLDWKAKHGGRCEMVQFTVVSAPEHHTAIESMIQQVCRDKAELAPLLKSLEVRVALFINPEGNAVKEYVLAGTAPAKAANVRPWWRFW
jgi:hypothetical protein